MQPDCVLELRSDDGSVRRLPLTDAGAPNADLRRVIAAGGMLFILRGRPAALEVRDLSTLTPLPLLGGVELQTPTDLAITAQQGGAMELYVVENVGDPRGWTDDEDRIWDVPRVARLRLDRHRAARGDVVVARHLNTIRRGAVMGGLAAWPTLEGLEVADSELRLVVREGTQRYAESFTFDGVLLARERVDPSVWVTTRPAAP